MTATRTHTGNEKSPGIAVLLSFLFTGAGQLYADQVQRGVLMLIIYVFLFCLMSVTMGVFGILLVPYWIWGMFDANKSALEYNARVADEVQQEKRSIEEDKEKEISGNEFATEIEKTHDLHEANLLDADEYRARKEEIIMSLRTKKPREGKEDFLVALIPSIRSKHLDDDEVAKIKQLVFARR